MKEIVSIDWILVFSHFLWILGASFLLVLFSYLDFLAHAEERKRREVFETTSFKIFFFLDLSVVFCGIGLSASFFWLALPFWGIAAVCFIKFLMLSKRRDPNIP